MPEYKKSEILAPCGSFACLTAAVKSGADACYLGADKFGARAYADNFDRETILNALDYAHQHSVRVYLTVNTLYKENEIGEVVELVAPLYEAGIDALIVQDFGAFLAFRKCFPGLSLHASTQMNITSWHAASLLEQLGASRVVPARELPLSELALIKEKTGLELEVFCHGAMCYSVSGQCLMSSLAGGRSGNRGRCAQPCRKRYQDGYLFSMKDLCALSQLPALMKIGTDSLKIEGRMKNEYYVASAVSAYREMRDAVLTGEAADVELLTRKLAEIYNRGGFTCGYLTGDLRDMISPDRPNHAGTKLGTVVGSKNGAAAIRVENAFGLSAGDVLELPLQNGEMVEITSGKSAGQGETVYLNAPKTAQLRINAPVVRSRFEKLISALDRKLAEKKKLPLCLEFSVTEEQKPMVKLSGSFFGETICGVAVGEVPLSVAEKPMPPEETERMIGEKLSQLGDTEFYAKELCVQVPPSLFVPAGIIKKLRRAAVEDLLVHLRMSCGRSLQEETYVNKFTSGSLIPDAKTCDGEDFSDDSEKKIQGGRVLSFQTREQLSATADFLREEDLLLLPPALLSSAKAYKNEIFLRLPDFVEGKFSLAADLPKHGFSGIYIGNPDGLAAYLENDCGIRRVMLGASLYAYNHLSIAFLRSLLPGRSLIFELPAELNLSEQKLLPLRRTAACCYGYTRVMLSRQCVFRNTSGCRKNEADRSVLKLKDDAGNAFYVETDCTNCINRIYNGIPLCEEPSTLSFADLLLYSFTVETAEEVKNVLSGNLPEKKTRGHYNRGVL